MPVSTRLSLLSLASPFKVKPASFEALSFLPIIVVDDSSLFSPLKSIVVDFKPSTFILDLFPVEKSTLSRVSVRVSASQLQPSSSFF